MKVWRFPSFTAVVRNCCVQQRSEVVMRPWKVGMASHTRKIAVQIQAKQRLMGDSRFEEFIAG